jgi:hypothetical protein
MASINHLFFLYEAFSVYFSNQGSQGILGQPSNQQLDDVFGSHKDDEVFKFILEKGQLQHSDTIGSGPGNLNRARGGVDNHNTGGR